RDADCAETARATGSEGRARQGVCPGGSGREIGTAPRCEGWPLVEAPFTLLVHLFSGKVITLPCESYEIVPPGVDESGNETPMSLNYTPVEGWQQTLGFLDFRAVTAIEVQRSADVI